MAVTSETSQVSLRPNGSQTAFPTSFKFIQSNDLKVELAPASAGSTPADSDFSMLTLGADYTATGANNDAGGTVTTTSAPEASSTLRITRTVPLTQSITFGTQMFSGALHTTALDKATMGLQQLQRDTAANLAAAQAALLAAIEAASIVGGAVSSSLVTALGSTTAVSLANRASRIFDVGDYGAAGDDTRDDIGAIRLAYAAARAAGGGTVRLIHGATHRITDGLVMGVSFVSPDDVIYGIGYDYTQGASYSASNLALARAEPWVNIDGNGATLRCDWTGSTGKAAIHCGISTSTGKKNTFNGAIFDFTILGKPGLGVDPTAAIDPANHQVGILAVLSPVKIWNVTVREMSRGFVMSDCYWGTIRDCQTDHCGDGFTLLAANGAKGFSLTANSCRSNGFLITGAGFEYHINDEECATLLWIPSCDNGTIYGGYEENVNTIDTDWRVKLGDTANAAEAQVQRLTIIGMRLSTSFGKSIIFHSVISAVLHNIRTYTSGPSANCWVNNAGCSISVIGAALPFQRNAFDGCVMHIIPGAGGATGGNVSIGVRAPGDPGIEAGPGFALSVRSKAPSTVVATPGAAGSLANATYYYVIVAFNTGGGQTDRSLETTAIVSAGGAGSVALTWDAVPGADRYYVYRGTTSGGQNKQYVVSTNSYTDTGAAATTASPGDSAGSLADIRFRSDDDSWMQSVGNFGFGGKPNGSYKNDFTGTAGFRALVSALAGQVVGAASLNASAILEADSTTLGFLPPRMTTTQRNAISSPAEGLVVYNTTTHKLNVYTGSTWEAVTST